MNEAEIKAKYPASRYMPVLVTEVTRMSKGYYCVAGWDVHGSRMVRPLSADGRNWRQADLSIFWVGHLVNCRPTGRRTTHFPHATEDLPLISMPEVIENLDEPSMYALLRDRSFGSISQLFGRALIDNKYLEDGVQCASLGGVFATVSNASFVEDGFGKMRFQFRDSDNLTYRLPVTSDWLRHLFVDGESDSEALFGLAEANEWLSVNPPDAKVIMRIGLARGWTGPNADWVPPRCYVQLNGIICPDDNYHIFAGPPSPGFEPYV